MPATIHSKLSQILSVFKSAIIYNGPYTENQVVVSLNDEPFPLAGEPFLVIVPGRQNRIEAQVSGSGNKLIGFTGINKFRLIDRFISDIAYQDTLAVLNAPDRIGMLDQVEALVQLMELKFPKDINGNALTEEPVRVEWYSEPVRYRSSEEWIAIDVFWEMSWYTECEFDSMNPYLV